MQKKYYWLKMEVSLINKKYALVSEYLGVKDDSEGVRKFVRLWTEFTENKEFLLLENKFGLGRIQKVLYFVKALYEIVKRRAMIDKVIYIPSAGETIGTLLKIGFFKMILKRKIILIVFVNRPYGKFKLALLRLIRPDFILSQNSYMLSEYRKLGIKNNIIPSCVDLEKFKPVSNTSKMEIRRHLGLPLNKLVVLHVGHFDINRNLELLIKFANFTDVFLIIIGGAFYNRSYYKSLIRQAKKYNVLFLCRYIADIEKFYQASDAYVFPVRTVGAISLPISVLEAMAVNLPVFTTRYGLLPKYFKETDGFYYFEDLEGLLKKFWHFVEYKEYEVNNREKVLKFNCKIVFSQVMEFINTV